MRQTKKRKTKVKAWRLLLSLGVLIVGLNGMAFYFLSRQSNPALSCPRVPHFLATVGNADSLTQTLAPAQFSNPDVVAAYQAAKTIPRVLAQQPCYCHCDRNMGHRSLLDCFAGKHGSECDICVKEALFATQEHRKGTSPEQIRNEIIHGDWKKIRF